MSSESQNSFNLTLQFGDRSVAVNNRAGNVSVGRNHEIDIKSMELASEGLKSWKTDIREIHIPRQETKTVLDWLHNGKGDKPGERVSVLVGNAGTGKSVVMHDILEELIKGGIPVLGIKMDQINFHSTTEFNNEVGLNEGISVFEAYKQLNDKHGLSVLLIDQIDALSMSLSVDRKAIDVANKLIHQVSTLPNVRIVVSCRRFDLDYDYDLQEYNRYNKVYLNGLTDGDVCEILNDLHVDPSTLTDQTRQFLSIPINLYLYSLIDEPDLLHGEPITLQKLYDRLWRKIVVDGRDIDRRKVSLLLRSIAEKMYTNQTLMISGKAYETEFGDEQKYLLSNNFLTGNEDDGIQFLHQSLFDYTYARTFVESGRSLIDELEREHQGLFVRSRVRQVLLYLREVDVNAFLRTLNEILFAKKSNGDQKIRFHLKTLTLNSLGLCEEVSEEEKVYFIHKVFPDKVFGPIFVSSIYSKDWFKIYTGHSHTIKRLRGNDDATIKDVMSVCWRLFTLDEDMVESYLEHLVSLDQSPINEAVFGLINQIGRYGKNMNRLISLYKAAKTEDAKISRYEFLEQAINFDSNFVATELSNAISTQLASYERKGAGSFSIDYETEQVYDALQKKTPDLAYEISLKAVHEIFDKTLLENSDRYFSSSWEFYTYNRGGLNAQESACDMLDFILSYIEGRSRTTPDKADKELSPLKDSKRDIDILIVYIGYIANPEYFIDEILSIFTDKELLEALSELSLLHYYSAQLLNASFKIFSIEEQRNILNILSTISPKWETWVFKGHTSNDYPNMRKGKSFGEYVQAIGDDNYIKEHFPDIYIKYQKVKDAYLDLNIEKPFNVRTQCGWVGMEKNAIDHMNDEQWLSSMRKYKDDGFGADFDKPTLTGHAMQLKACAKENPSRYAALIIKATEDLSIKLTYPLYGFEGLSESDIEKEKFHEVFQVIAKRFEGDVNKNSAGSLIDFLRSLKFFLKKEWMPEDVFEFICNAVINAKEDDDSNKPDDKEPWQTGINRARGVAGELLVDCSIFKDLYGDKIFSVLNSIADNASITTRAAILLNGARLNMIDPDRSLELYLKMMHDCQPTLISIPLHDLNPVVYYINYGFDKLIPLYKEAIQKPACHKVLAETLWIAYVKDKKGAADLLKEVIHSSQEAATSFIMTVVRYHTMPLSKSLRFLVDLMSCKDEKIDRVLGNIYNSSEFWSHDDCVNYTKEYVEHDCCIYATRSFYEFLSVFAKDEPAASLEWIITVYQKKKHHFRDDQNGRFDIQKILEILTQSYNGVRKYSPRDELVEKAMDIMDEIMQDPESREYLHGFLNELDRS